VKTNFSLGNSGSQHSVIKIAADLASATASKNKKENTIMRKQLVKGFTTFGLFLTLIVGSVQAQTGYQMEVNIPFDFTAGRTSLTAGIYSVKLISENMLLVRSSDGTKNVLLLARQAEHVRTRKPARVIFNRYGDRYFLSETFFSEADLGCQVNPSRAERDLAAEYRLAKSSGTSQKVEVALR
jgi:hypothetical protein